ncbi:MAG: hypothetical protein H7839_18740 [Magnetococcus sp. YQC-5]
MNVHIEPICGAKRRDGNSCQNPGLANGRCHQHGGTATGPRTTQGRANSRLGPLKHGLMTKETIRQMRLASQMLRESNDFLRALAKGN